MTCFSPLYNIFLMFCGGSKVARNEYVTTPVTISHQNNKKTKYGLLYSKEKLGAAALPT